MGRGLLPYGLKVAVRDTVLALLLILPVQAVSHWFVAMVTGVPPPDPMGFVADKVVVRQVLRFPPTSIIPPLLHISMSFYHWWYTVLATETASLNKTVPSHLP